MSNFGVFLMEKSLTRTRIFVLTYMFARTYPRIISDYAYMIRRRIMSAEVKALKPHVSINVRNVNESVEFYRKMFGIEPAKVRKGYAKFDVQNPPLNLALNEIPFDGRGALSHLGIQVASTEDVLAVREKWD